MNTIRGRLMVVLVAGLTVVLAAGGAVVYWIVRVNLLQQMDAGLRVRAEALAALVSFDDGKVEFEFEDDSAEPIGDGWFEYRSPSGDVLRQSGNMTDVSMPSRSPGLNQIVLDDVTLSEATTIRVAWLAFYPRAIHDDEQQYAPSQPDPEILVVAAAADRAPIDRALGAVLTALFVAGGILELTIIMLVSVGVRWGLAPLNRLQRQLGDRGRETVSSPINSAGAARELLPVYRELNSMLGRVQQTLERERLFTDAAAHELRTPLAELRAAAEVAIRWPDAGQSAVCLNQVLGIAQDMERIVRSLLLISRANARTIDSSAVAVDVSRIVQDSLSGQQARIDQKRLRVTISVNGQTIIRAPQAALETIIRNLIDNAVQYTPSGGALAIMPGTHDHGSTLVIVRNGPVDISTDDLPRLFEPFWRSEAARSDREHVGLGLTVVSRMAQAVGLQVDAVMSGRDLEFHISRAGSGPDGPHD